MFANCKMFVPVLLLLLLCLLSHICAQYNPFSIEYQGKYYKTKYSDTKRLKLITLKRNDNSTFSINMGGKELQKVLLQGKDDNVQVKIYPSSYNPLLFETKNKVTITVLCEFSYPVKVVSGGDTYQCSLFYTDMTNQHQPIGICPLRLQYKSSNCLITGTVDNLRDKHNVHMTATVNRCRSTRNCHGTPVVNTSLTIPLVSWHHLIWMTTFMAAPRGLGILIGVPKNPINKSTNFEIPVKLKANKNNENIVSVQLQIIYNVEITMEEIIPVACFEVMDSNSYTDNGTATTDVKLRRDDTGQCSKPYSDHMMAMQMTSTKEDSKPLVIQIIIENIIFKNNIDNFNSSVEKSHQKRWITIPLFHGKHTFVPVFNNPIILPSFEEHTNPFELSRSDLKIYYIYEETQLMEVSDNVKCRPFDSSRLKCPANMKQLVPVFTNVDNADSLRWSLELMINGLVLLIKIEPLVRPDDEWIVIFQDSVLNVITGWNGIQRSKDASLLQNAKCEPLYQVAKIQIYKKLLLYCPETNETIETIVDMSELVNFNNIRISKNAAHVFERGNSLIIQGTRYGNIAVDLISQDNRILLKSSMTVYDEAVNVTDLDISCISDIDVISKLIFTSAHINAYDFQFKFQNRNFSGSCFMVIDILFSDKSRINVASFPKDQYSLKFITNRQIIEVFDQYGMWYNSNSFDGQTSFNVELQESRLCHNPRTIFIKQVRLNMSSSHSTVLTNLTTWYSTTNASFSTIPSPTSNTEKTFETKSLKGILGTVIALALIIVIVNIIFQCYKRKQFIRNSSCRRKSLKGEDINNMVTDENGHHPLLPPPGPQVQLSDPSNVTISSPHSFWCLDPKKSKRGTQQKAFVRQSSLPIKGSSTRGFNEIAPCPPLRWANQMVPTHPDNDFYSGQDGLSCNQAPDLLSCSPMAWSVTNLDVDQSSGVGSLNTNMDDMLKDPYGSRERFHKLSELPCTNSSNRNDIYNIV